MVWKDEYEDERDARFINDRVHGNIQKDGTFSVIPEMPGGLTTPDQLRRIADVVDKYQVPLLKLTGGQRIDLVGIPKEHLPDVWRDLDMPAGWAWGKSYRTCKSCIGIDYCRFGLGDSMGLAQKIEARFRGLDSPAKLKLATAGCPRNCSEAYVKDVGAVAVGERQVGDLHRRRRGRAHPQGRSALHGRRRRRGAAARRALHAVLPREREVEGAHLRLRRARRPRPHQGRGAGRRPRHRGGTRSRDAGLGRRGGGQQGSPGRRGSKPKTPNQFAEIISGG